MRRCCDEVRRRDKRVTDVIEASVLKQPPCRACSQKRPHTTTTTRWGKTGVFKENRRECSPDVAADQGAYPLISIVETTPTLRGERKASP
jgi:hypothetical protein